MTTCEECGGLGWLRCSGGGPHGLAPQKKWCTACYGVGWSGSTIQPGRLAEARAAATERAQREGWIDLPAMDTVCMAGDGEGRR